MKAATWKRLDVAIPAFIAAGAVMCNLVRYRIFDEAIVRSTIWHLSLLAVPTFVVLAYREWTRLIRSELPAWRNGLGLASMVIVSATWLFYAALSVLQSIRPGPRNIYADTWTSLFLFSIFAAVLLATALKGAPRIQTIAAALLMWDGLLATLYFDTVRDILHIS